ncbi:MAG: Swt1 family HEPN domain-containing protein [Microbacterium sp.]|uniref:Swt1 family HEPN domain-containing protein n=1 Tax=Microbacterium sp. TaxID=51671 RepID=UPI00272172FF|nr:Swt1 family HEPN domain-containing protein [Microbacterium sp.]MDO8383491.1 Swt1 family HEPN domain-containing protein [Microbacterium sp.]
MADGARYLVGESLDDLAEGLRPFIEATFAEQLPNGPTWVQVMTEKDAVAGRPTTHHHANDIGLMLRVITEKLGTLGYPFDRRLSRQAVNWASELREVRNRYAHQVDFTPAETYRALDSAELLLREIGADEEASRVAHRKPAVMAILSGGHVKPLPMPPPAPAPMPGGMGEPAIHGLPSPPVAPTATHSADQDSSPVPLTRRSLREVQEPQASARPEPPTPAGRAQLTVESVTELSYAVAHARIVAVQEVRIAYDGPELRGASLEIEAICAAGSLGGPKVVLVDLAPNGTVVITAPDLLMLDPGAMLAVDTQQPGQIRATLRDPNGEVIAEQANDVVVLAANQWIARELHLGLELLASFVQPQASALTPVLQAASDRLATATGRSDLDGYQSDNPERVDAMVESIWEAVRYGDIRYAEPPASWGISGQKVRTPHEVLEGRLGTCLDTTVTLAALLEQVGINSTLWLTESHIFLGYWREDATLGDPATTDIEEVINLAEMGKIGLLETTMVTGGEASRSFADARGGASPFLAERRNDVLGITDIRGARENSILPLPSRSVSETGEVVVTEYRLAAAAPVAP